MTPTEIAADIKNFFERGAQLLESHVPALVARAAQAEGDPLVQAVEAAILPASVRILAADFISKLAAEFPPPVAEPVPAPEPVPVDPAAPPA